MNVLKQALLLLVGLVPVIIVPSLSNAQERVTAFIESIRKGPDGVGDPHYRAKHGLDKTTAEEAAALLDALKDTDYRVRAIVIAALAEAPVDKERAISLTAPILTGDPHPEVRASSASVLPLFGPDNKVVIDALSKGAKDSDARVREQSIIGLGQSEFHGPNVAPLLIESMKDENDRVRTASAGALLSAKPTTDEARQALANAHVEEDPYLQHGPGFIAAWTHQHEEDTATLLKDLASPIAAMRAGAATHLGNRANTEEINRSEAIPLLIDASKDVSEDVREAAAFAIGNLGTGQPNEIAALAALLRDISPGVRLSALLAVEQMNKFDQQLADALTTFRTDSDPGLRATAETLLFRAHKAGFQPSSIAPR